MKCHLPTGREGYFKWGKSFAKSGTGGGLGPDPGGPGGLGAPMDASPPVFTETLGSILFLFNFTFGLTSLGLSRGPSGSALLLDLTKAGIKKSKKDPGKFLTVEN